MSRTVNILRLPLALIVLCVIASVSAIGDDDKITALPGVNFEVNFDQYSGYLNAGKNGTWKFFYWLVESQSGNASTDPLVVWFNGGPGCSSVGGLFEELGPFYVYKDGATLYENIYAWNKNANVLAIESPIGVGFSYDTENHTAYTVGDDLTAQQNHDALADFFNRVQPRYNNSRWFISGESYAGIYIPTVTQNVLHSIKNETFPNKNFGGIAIGNGYSNIQNLTNALVLWSSYHGAFGLYEWRDLKEQCCVVNGTGEVGDVDYCDFASHFDATWFNNTKDECGKKVLEVLNLDQNMYDAYNFYQDCYLSDYLTNTKKFINKGLLRTPMQPSEDITAADLYEDSTDNQNGYPCYNGLAARVYLRQPEVLKAFHVDPEWNGTWRGCNDPLNENYPVKYVDTYDIFVDIINIATDPAEYVKDFRILIYNGDVDTVCNFLGDAWHFDNIAQNTNLTVLQRKPWLFRSQLAGFHQPYYTTYDTASGKANFTLDVVTVKGSGHFVPNDRQGQSLQMITNFINSVTNYNATDSFNATPKPAQTFTTVVPDTTTKGCAGLSLLASMMLIWLGIVLF
uniref:Carboxypeptidase n=1 Tax=Panagrellus redivivus TaxID=6233 RepID=A0A7E4VI92_PANRE